MHPQVRQLGPGHCPLCGMALEPVLATVEQGESPELRDMRKRFWIGTALTVPVFALEMGGYLTNLNHLLGQQMSNRMQLLLGTPVVLWAGWPFFERAVASVRNRSLNMFSLMRSVPALPGRTASWERLRRRGSPRTFAWPMAPSPSTSLGLAPKTAVQVKADGNDESVQVDSIQVGDLLGVRPGEKLPVDGEITEGKGNVDESMVTGEPIPGAKSAGSKVTAGTLDQTGGFVMRADPAPGWCGGRRRRIAMRSSPRSPC